MPIDPKSIKWDSSPKLDASQIKWDDSDSSIMDKAKGVGEEALNFGTGAISGLGGGLTYLGTLAATGDTDAAKAVQEETNKTFTYAPRTEKGKEYNQNVSHAFEKTFEYGGKAAQRLIEEQHIRKGMKPLTDEDRLMLDSIGKAGTEMALNVADPMLAIRGLKVGLRPKAEAPHVNLEGLDKPAIAPEEVKWDTSTQGHADDFAATNPYDVAGHVTAAEQGRPSTIDSAQPDLFGGDILQNSETIPPVGQSSILHDTIPYTKEFPFELEPMDRVPTDSQMGINMPEGSVPGKLAEFNNDPYYGTREQARAKERDMSAEEQAHHEAEARKQAEIDEVYQQQGRKYEADLNHIEAQRELDFAEATRNIESMGDRRLFTDRTLLDLQHASDVVGDKTLMGPEHTTGMVDSLRKGDTMGALDVIVQNHPNLLYRKLATFLKEHLNGLQIRIHDEPMLRAGERDVTGYYDPETHTVGLSGVGAVSPHTVLHEIAHGVTSRFINERPNDIRVMGLKSLYNDMATKIGEKFPGIANLKEFVAETFSNPEFQSFLKGQHMNNRSVWQRFMDSVKSLLGMRSGIHTELTDALEHALDLSKQVAEAQSTSTKGKLEATGMSRKLVDLMAETPKDVPGERRTMNENSQSVMKGIPGLKHAMSDFAHTDTIPELIRQAQEGVDIPSNTLEKAAQQLQSGGLFESLKTRNPVVRGTFSRISMATQMASKRIRDNLTNKQNGLATLMTKMDKQAKADIHSAMMLVEGQRELSGHELAGRGFSENQINYFNRYRELSKNFFNELNGMREKLGLKPMDERVSHIAGRFMGDYAVFVKDAEGNIKGRLGANTKWELNRTIKYMKKRHPEYDFGEREYNAIGGKERKVGDRFTGLMEAINWLEKTDADASRIFDSYREFLKQDAINYLNATRHAKAKVKDAGGIVGSEGHKPWQSAAKNAEEGMKAQLSYFEQGYQWMEFQKASEDLKPMLSDPTITERMPNAVAYANAYKAHAMGRDPGAIGNAMNTILSTVGQYSTIGHTNLIKLNAKAKHLMMQKFMGFLNVPFSVTQLMQPLQTHPAMIALMKSRGLEFVTAKAQYNAVETYLKGIAEHHLGRDMQMTHFQRDALKYAEDRDIFNVQMADHTKDINESRVKKGFDKLADANIVVPEALTRGASFLFYAHALHDAGIPAKDVFSAAEHMTSFSMVDYRPIERPMGYAKLGWVGDLASTLTRYKHNQLSQAAFYAREGIREKRAASTLPIAAFVGTSLAMGGIMGFFGYNEADSAYQLFSKYVLKKPDSITNHLLSGNVPTALTHGVFSLAGLDMTTRFSNANIIPDTLGGAILPYGSAVLDMAASTGNFVMDPTSETRQKQMIKSWAPQSAQGLIENTMMTGKDKDGKPLYINHTDGPNFGKGRVSRDEHTMALRNFGFRDVNESKELAKNYSDSQIEKGNKDIVDGLLSKAQLAAMDGKLTPQMLKNLTERAVSYGESAESFTAKMVTWSMDHRLSQSQQIMLRRAQQGYKGAFNAMQAAN